MNRHFREPDGKGVKVAYRDSLGRSRTWTPKQDREDDKEHGIREGSAQDNRLDRERGVPVKRR